MVEPERTASPSSRKQIYFPDESVRTASMEEAERLGQSWSMYCRRLFEHFLAIRHPDEGWNRFEEFEEDR